MIPTPKRTGKRLLLRYRCPATLDPAKEEWVHLCMIGWDYVWTDDTDGWLNTPTSNPEIATEQMLSNFQRPEIIKIKQ